MLKRLNLFLIMLVVLVVIFLPLIVLAQEAGEPEEIRLGQYAIPVLISMLLMIAFNYLAIGDRYKPLIAIGFGVLLAMIAIPYHRQPWTLVVIVDYLFYGIMSGSAAVGLYEGQKAFRESHRV